MKNLGKGQIFGVEDVMNLRNYTFEVKCVSETAEIFQISAPEFIARFSKDEKTWKFLKSMTKTSDNQSINSIVDKFASLNKRRKVIIKEKNVSKPKIDPAQNIMEIGKNLRKQKD